VSRRQVGLGAYGGAHSRRLLRTTPCLLSLVVDGFNLFVKSRRETTSHYFPVGAYRQPESRRPRRPERHPLRGAGRRSVQSFTASGHRKRSRADYDTESGWGQYLPSPILEFGHTHSTTRATPYLQPPLQSLNPASPRVKSWVAAQNLYSPRPCSGSEQARVVGIESTGRAWQKITAGRNSTYGDWMYRVR